jgi:predicted metal-dependent peptidase
MVKVKVPIELAEARVNACRVWPDASHVILSMSPVATPNLYAMSGGFIGVDQFWRLHYDPEWLAKADPYERVRSVLHETAHCLGKHHVRAAKYVSPTDKPGWKRWNYACDLAVWEVLRMSGQTMPENGVTIDKYGFPENLSVEQYWKLLKEQEEEQQKQRESDEQEAARQDKEEEDEEEDDNHSQQGDSEDDTDAEPGDDSQGDDGDEGSDGGDSDRDDASEQGDDPGEDGGSEGDDGSQGDGSGDGPAGTEDGADEGGSAGDGGSGSSSDEWQGVGGSCADGMTRPWELPPPGTEGEGASEEAPGVEPWEQDVLVRHAAERAAASGRGTQGGFWNELIDTYKEPKLDPRRLLRKKITASLSSLQSGSGRFTFRRPARRPGLGGVLTPTNCRTMPRILVIIDTSGSMSTDEMKLGVGLVSSCLARLNLRDGIDVIAGDTYAAWEDKVFDPRRVQLVGRGGTDMSRIIQDAADKKAHERPQLIICVTDGETPWPKERLCVPVIAGFTRKSYFQEYYPPPAWIDSVNLY